MSMDILQVPAALGLSNLDEIVINQGNPGVTRRVQVGRFLLAAGVGFLVQFSDLSTPTPTAWSWDFGDGGTSILQNPLHLYLTPGVYTVSLTAIISGVPTPVIKVGYITITS